jgi:hypothetical protein
VIFSVYLILPDAVDPGIYSASNKNKYQKRENKVSGELSEAGAWQMTLITSVSEEPAASFFLICIEF